MQLKKQINKTFNENFKNSASTTCQEIQTRIQQFNLL